MRLCFVGHDFHRRTGSSAFFVDILRSMGEVVEFYTDPDGDPSRNDRVIRTLIDARFECTIFWQTERIAERLLPFDNGRTIIVPMYDSAGHLPDAFWQKFVKAQILSFTRILHERLQRLRCDTSYFQFFPPVSALPVRERGAVRDAFFWERTPRGTLNLESVLRHCRALGIERLHLHAAPDFASEDPAQTASVVDGVEITVSKWLPLREDYDALAEAPMFFFAPRLLEGIGMASLEAMGRGQIVVAPDRPATSEYVAHLTSGLLYDPDAAERSTLPALDDAALARISRGALRKATSGHHSWLGDIDRLKSIIADDGRRWHTGDDSAGFAGVIRHAARQRAGHAS